MEIFHVLPNCRVTLVLLRNFIFNYDCKGKQTQEQMNSN